MSLVKRLAAGLAPNDMASVAVATTIQPALFVPAPVAAPAQPAAMPDTSDPGAMDDRAADADIQARSDWEAAEPVLPTALLPMVQDDAVLLAQSSRGALIPPVASDAGPAGSGADAQAAAAVQPQDQDSPWWMLGLLALGGLGGGGGGAAAPAGTAVPLADVRSTFLFEDYPNLVDSTANGADDRNYPGRENEFRFTVSPEAGSTLGTVTFSWSYAMVDGQFVSHASMTYNGVTTPVRTTTFADDASFSTFMANEVNALLGQFTGTTPATLNQGGSVLTFEIGGYTVALNLDNASGNSNFINHLDITADGSFTLATGTQVPLEGMFDASTQTFEASTRLVLAGDIDPNNLPVALIGAPFVMIAGEDDVDLDPTTVAAQIYVFDAAGDYKVLTVTGDSTPAATTAEELFRNGSYSIFPV